ncbi:MAG: Lon-like protease [Acidimicrobiaceae bacterium]
MPSGSGSGCAPSGDEAGVARWFPTISVAGLAPSTTTSLVTVAIANPATTRQMTNVDNLSPSVPGDQTVTGSAGEPLLPLPVPGEAPAPDGMSPAPRARRRIHRAWWVSGGVLFVVIALLVATLLIEVPYEIIAPGKVTATNGRVQVGGSASTFPPSGEIDFVTVTVDSHVTVLEKFQAEHDGDVEIEKRTISPAQDTQVNTALMVQSKDTAVLVALQKLGYDLGSDGAQVVEVVTGMPADGIIQPGETIVAIDGQPIKTTAQLRDVFAAHKPSDTVALDLQGTDGTARTASVTLGENPDKPGVAFLGVSLQDRVHLPFDVTVDSGRVLGPSAGLAFTLSILDLLTPGELTGGQRVAVTGEIRSDGSIGPIGGVKEKVTTVRRAGIHVFLVPQDNYDEAKAKAGDSIQVVPVANLDDALRVLAGMGGNGLALGDPGGSAPPG